MRIRKRNKGALRAAGSAARSSFCPAGFRSVPYYGHKRDRQPLMAAGTACMIKAEERQMERSLGKRRDHGMNIVLAAAILLLLLVHVGQENGPARNAPGQSKENGLDFLDELEILDAATDDFI